MDFANNNYSEGDKLYPLKLKPAIKDYIWGGNKLKTDFNIASDKDKIAEAWELSTHEDGSSIVLNGEFKGKTLSEVLSIWGIECPILIKLIDAKDDLSIQVHPNDEYAQKFENSKGKTEMWYIIDCDEDASLIYGFKKNISKEELKKAIQNDTLLEILNKVKVKKGDVFFIEAGTIHSIGKGILLAEIQQSSNITYRVYDYGRVGIDGKPRQLNIDKALEVANLKVANTDNKQELITKTDGYKQTLLAKCDYFIVNKLDIETKAELISKNNSFISLIILEGKGNIKFGNDLLEFDKGDSFYIPPNFGLYIIEGRAEIILTQLK